MRIVKTLSNKRDREKEAQVRKKAKIYFWKTNREKKGSNKLIRKGKKGVGGTPRQNHPEKIQMKDVITKINARKCTKREESAGHGQSRDMTE